MGIDDFINHFMMLLEDTDSIIFNAETEFHELDEWSSFLGLSVIAMVDDIYEVRLNGDDIRKSITINDLYLLIKSRL